MKEQSEAPDQQDRDLITEREYQRVTISGEEKCGVNQSRLKRNKLCDFSQANGTSSLMDICCCVVAPLFHQGSIHRPAGCCQMCSKGSVHQAKVYESVSAELLQDHHPLPSGAERETSGLRHL